MRTLSRNLANTVAVFALVACTAGPALAQAARPNIVMFIMDDLGYGDVGSYGAPDAKTPNIDRIAREGVKLTDFYANHANCSPTRTGFITGRYQQRYGIESPLRLADDRRSLPASDTSMPRLLKSAGYATGLVGKWHLGAGVESGPNRHGFDEFWGFRFGAIDYYTHVTVTSAPKQPASRPHDLYHNEAPTTATGYLTDEITARAESFIQQRALAPFFLEVAYNATHWPFQAPDLPEGKRDFTNAIEDGTRADYVAMLERADRGVGRILDLLDRLKLAPNTIVVFTSDNGGEWLSRNAPLFHRKSSLWEGGIRVPLLVRWPARLKPGTTSPQVGITMDITASILAAARAPVPETYRLEGIDLIGALQKGTIVERTLFWRMPSGPNAASDPQAPPSTQRAVRRGNWKYVDDRGQYFLFDLGKDPGERHDVAQSHANLVRELRGLVEKWEADVDAEWQQRSKPVTSASAQATSDKSDVIITPSIHSSIQLEHNGKVIQIDPWSQGDLSKLKPADLILITDDVNHHLDVKAIAKLRKPGAPVVIAANGLKQVPDGVVMANGDTRDVAGFRIEATSAYDVTPGASFHPKGEANGYIISIGGQRIYIVGVTECVPEIRAARNIDVAFFPMNLPAARMEPAAAIDCVKAFNPKVVYPYHYDQDWVTRVNRGEPRGTPTTRGLQEMKNALQAAGIEVRLAEWYPPQRPESPVRH